MNAHDIVFIGSLVDRCPSLLQVLQEHLDDYDTLLPHVFMGDVARWATERYRVGADDDEALVSVLGILEAAFAAGRSDDRELIAASFLENLPRDDDPGSDLRDVIGPSLRDHMKRFG